MGALASFVLQISTSVKVTEKALPLHAASMDQVLLPNLSTGGLCCSPKTLNKRDLVLFLGLGKCSREFVVCVVNY